MSDIETEEVKWLWYPYIPIGKVTIIQGDPGEGKTSLGHDLVVLGKELERLDEPAPLTPAPMHIDKKRWKELQKKKTALGHKPDDHEDKQTWQQTM